MISLPSTFYNIAGKVQRIAELHEVIDELQLAATPTPTPVTATADVAASTTGAAAAAAAADSDGGTESASTAEAVVGPFISFEGVDIVSPGGDSFAKGVSFTVPQGAGVCPKHYVGVLLLCLRRTFCYENKLFPKTGSGQNVVVNES
eukprot:COSAG06_NODE_1480_length_9321_cov_14.755042_4_plen_147_part_00